LSGSSEEFEAKLGQFIYTMVMYERLKEYLLDKAASRRGAAFRIELGMDREGNSVYLDIRISKEKKEVKHDVEPRAEVKRHVTLVMVNEKLTGSDASTAPEVERLVTESFKWWHGYYGDRDRLSLDSWRAVSSSEADCVEVSPIYKIPINSISIPSQRPLEFREAEAEFLSSIVDALGPVYVRRTLAGSYELIAGLPKIIGCVKAGREFVDAQIIEPGAEEGERLLEIDESFRRLLKWSRV